MTELRKTTKSTHYVDYFDMQNYLTEKLGKRVEIIESPNDTDYSIDIEKGDIYEYDQDTIDEFIENGYIYMDYGYHTIFKYLCNQGIIEEGNYVIRVSW